MRRMLSCSLVALWLPKVVSEPQDGRKACSQQCLVVEDLATGWEGGCYGLQKYPSETQEECRANCCADAACEVWQFSYTGCWRGKGHNCLDGRGFQHRPENLRLVAAQRITHGTVKVLGSLAGRKCLGLKEEKYFSSMFEEDLIDRCRTKCYSDTSCGTWQVANGTCLYGRALLCREDIRHAQWVVASEKIRHECNDGSEMTPFSNVVAFTEFSCLMLLTLALGLCLVRGCTKDRSRRFTKDDFRQQESTDQPPDRDAIYEEDDSFSEGQHFLSHYTSTCSRADLADAEE